jgi:crossover junction endodeoxyribonuclease RuvC
MGNKSRQLWKAYIEGKAKPERSETSATQHLVLSAFKGVVMGIDPSLRATGIAVVRFETGSKTSLLHRETVKVPASQSAMHCLARIAERCEAVANAHHPDHIAVEQTIYVQNYRTAMILGSAKGAALAGLARMGLPIHEYPPLRIKQAVVGNGRATKSQVALMVGQLLLNPEWDSADESDAAGAALCHGLTIRSQLLK